MDRCNPTPVGWLVALALTGCFAPDYPVGLPCSPTEDCPPGQHCASAAPNQGMCIADQASADRDHDGVDDAIDNCPDVGNLEQRDHDGDGDGDVCDNCPAAANSDQADTTEPTGIGPDGVGDACDPFPAARDRLWLFDDFTTGADPRWQLPVDVAFQGGFLVPLPSAPLADADVVFRDLPVAKRVALEIAFTITATDREMQYPATKAVIELFQNTDNTFDSYECGVVEGLAPAFQREVGMAMVDNNNYTGIDQAPVPTTSALSVVRVARDRELEVTTCVGEVASQRVSLRNATAQLPAQPTLGFFSYRTRSQFDYAAIYVDQP